MKISWTDKAFLLGLIEKRVREEPDCKPAKRIKEAILKESPVLRRILYGNEGKSNSK